MSEPFDINMVVRPTGNEWDAPVFIQQHDDGSHTIARQLPDQPAPPYWVWPHAVLLIEGVMSPFDQRRQPHA